MGDSMKKGDLVRQIVRIPKHTTLIRGMDEEAKVKLWMEQNCSQHYGKPMAYRIVEDDVNAGRFMAESLVDDTRELKAKVNWVVEDEVSITEFGGDMRIVEVKDWEVYESAIPSYQSQVDNMSEDELREALDTFRSKRVHVVKTTVKVKAKVDNSPMAKALEKLGPEAKAKLMKDLGMVD